MKPSDRRLPNILLVEDNPGDVLLIKDAFESCEVHCSWVFASNGADALEKLLGNPLHSGFPNLDLIIMDMNLPRLSGHEVLSRIKQDERLCSIPVLMITSSNAAKDAQTSYRLRANAHVSKPESHAGFCELVQAVQRIWLRELG